MSPYMKYLPQRTWGLVTPVTIGWDDAFDGNGKLKKKLSCFQFSTSQLRGDYLST